MANTMVLKRRDLGRLRRIALNAQGLLYKAPFGLGLSGARKAIEHIGYVQIDTISVVQRAHHHVLHSRVPNYHPDMLNKMLKERHIFEYWSHAASFLPMRDYRFSLLHRRDLINRRRRWFEARDENMITDILRRVEQDGPIRSRDLEDPHTKRKGWWNWKPAKRALEQLYFEGDLMVTHRDGFQKAYDLTERVLPTSVDTSIPTYDEYAIHLIDQQIRCHGLVTRKGITYMRTSTELQASVKREVERRLATGQFTDVQLPDGQNYLLRTASLEAATPKSTARLKILSPFDNAVIQRERLQSLFAFDYLIECYVPEPKRKFGYFSLPLIYKAAFIGRIDCKAHRKTNLLEVRALQLEDNLKISYTEVASALIEAISPFATFQGCEKICITDAQPRAFGRTLKHTLEQGDSRWVISTRNI